jgi:hypothetical protein
MFADLADKPVGRPGFGAAQDDTGVELAGAFAQGNFRDAYNDDA